MKKPRKNKHHLKILSPQLILSLIIVYLLFFVKFNLSIDNFHFKQLSLAEYLLIKNKLMNEMFSNHPEIINIKTKISFLNRNINLETTKEKPVAKICYLNNCYLLGEHSYIYNNKRELQSSLLLTITSQLPIATNTRLDPSITTALAKVFEYSNIKNLYLTKAEILSNKDIIFFTQNFSFLLDPNRKNLDEQLKKLDYFLNQYHQPFQQIDLRIYNKIYFK
jgi:hypothetical protein